MSGTPSNPASKLNPELTKKLLDNFVARVRQQYANQRVGMWHACLKRHDCKGFNVLPKDDIAYTLVDAITKMTAIDFAYDMDSMLTQKTPRFFHEREDIVRMSIGGDGMVPC